MTFPKAVAFTLASVLTVACGSSSVDPDAADAASAGVQQGTVRALPGATFYPENLEVAADGTLYVGSLGTGAVVRFAPGATTSTPFLAGGDPKGVTGLELDPSGTSLWLCAVDLGTTPPSSELRQYDLAGAKLATIPFGTGAFCNDLAFDGAGNAFVADSFGAVWRLAHGSSVLVEWARDPLLTPSTASGFGADGIALDGAGNLWVTAFSDGRLLRIPILPDGSAGTVTPITVTPALRTPDGMRALDATTLVVADGAAGALTKIAISPTATTATSTALATGLNGPTGVAVTGDRFWVSEGQIGHFTGQLAGGPTTPFDVVPVAR